jgi:hypothetical protein
VHSIKVINLNNLVVYDTITKAAKTVGCDRATIKRCCMGLTKYAGTTKEGTPIKWMLYDDYLSINKDLSA